MSTDIVRHQVTDPIWLRSISCSFGGIWVFKYLMVPLLYAWMAYQARLVLPWVFRPDYLSPKYEQCFYEIHLVCRSTQFHKVSEILTWQVTSPPVYELKSWIIKRPVTEKAMAWSSVATASVFLSQWQLDNEHVIVFADDDIATRNETDIRKTFSEYFMF